MPAKSQWDFGELFPAETTRKVFSVGELTEEIRKILERQFNKVWVAGEISNLRAQPSGHIYFTLKDTAAQLSCVLFRGEFGIDRSILQDGRMVLLHGEVTVYGVRGQYQLRVLKLELQGIGALQLAFEKLKQKLQAEGLFASERKRLLPRFPVRVGLVTSASGAAIHDFVQTVRRRNPALKLFLAPCRVQGDCAADEIAGGIRLLNEWSRSQPSPHPFPKGRGSPALVNIPTNPNDVPPLASPARTPLGEGQGKGLDLIVVMRGGGSLEDLWSFNEEIVARAIFNSELPVISAVGHETDFTISDFVADVRAATPTAAAEIVTQDAFAAKEFLAALQMRLRRLAEYNLERARQAVRGLSHRLSRLHPRRTLNEFAQRLDDFSETMSHVVSTRLKRVQNSALHLSLRLNRVHPRRRLNEIARRLDQDLDRMSHIVSVRLKRARDSIRERSHRLNRVHPRKTLSEIEARLDEYSARMSHSASTRMKNEQLATQVLANRVTQLKPRQTVRRRRELLESRGRQLQQAFARRVQKEKHHAVQIEARLRLLSPLNVIARGYSITFKADTGKLVRSTDDVVEGDMLNTQLARGTIRSKVIPAAQPSDNG